MEAMDLAEDAIAGRLKAPMLGANACTHSKNTPKHQHERP